MRHKANGALGCNVYDEIRKIINRTTHFRERITYAYAVVYRYDLSFVIVISFIGDTLSRTTFETERISCASSPRLTASRIVQIAKSYVADSLPRYVTVRASALYEQS
jgi:hypothetical protein